MTDVERFRHDRSAYERPNEKFVCGRAAAWGKPCARGPNANGSCGGTTECTPFLNKGRYECRRPKTAGGPCANGPLPDGTCCLKSPPCAPKPTLRRWRRRAVLLTFFGVAALLLALAKAAPEGSALQSRNPGTLSGAHVNFTLQGGCGTCHEGHKNGLAGVVPALFKSHDMSDNCLACHKFGGPEKSPHNRLFAERTDLPAVKCESCHIEHRGESAQLAKIDAGKCNACHGVKFAAFSSGHPAFKNNYPYRSRTDIHFNHVQHLEKHFKDSRYTDKAPQGCVGCHDVASAGRDVRQKPFERTCAGCHEDSIKNKAMAVFGVPELPAEAIAQLKKSRQDVAKACDLPPSQIADDAYGDSNSIDNLLPTASVLLNVDAKPDKYGTQIAALLVAMAKGGAGPLAEAVKGASGSPDPTQLLAGLSPELAKRVACAWATNHDYNSGDAGGGGGWSGTTTTLSYVPRGHADPVLKAWLDFAADAPANAKGRDSTARAAALRAAWLTPDGPGVCAKCHAVTTVTDGKAKAGEDERGAKVAWGARIANKATYTAYNHRPHINLLGPDASCTNCHTLNPDKDYDSSFKTWDASKFVSSFNPVGVDTCQHCHAAGRVREDCQLCHRYHLDPGFKQRMM